MTEREAPGSNVECRGEFRRQKAMDTRKNERDRIDRRGLLQISTATLFGMACSPEPLRGDPEQS